MRTVGIKLRGSGSEEHDLEPLSTSSTEAGNLNTGIPDGGVTDPDMASKSRDSIQVPLRAVNDRHVVEIWQEDEYNSSWKSRSIDEHEKVEYPWRAVHLVNSVPNENRLVIPLLFEGVSTTALVDTGANDNYVDGFWLKKHGIQIDEPRSESISGFGDGNKLSVLGVGRLNVKIPNLEMQPVEYKVLASNKLPQIPIILGVKFLDVNAITISLERARLTQVRDDGAITEVYFSKRTGDRGAVVEQPTTVYRNIPCFAGESGSIPSGEMVPLSIVWRNGEGNLTGDMQPGKSSPMFLLEEPDNFWDVQVVSGIIDAAEYATVLVANKGETKKKIKKGDLLGSISTIVVVDDPVSTVEILATSTESHEEAHSPPCDNKIDIREILNLEKHLTDEQIEAVVKTLNPLHAVFSSGDQDIGKLGLTKHRIELWDETPIYQRPRRLPEPVCQEIENQCQELELLDIIEPSKSAWSSPIVPVRKKDGKIRLCIDYRKLNAVTKSDKFPLPNLNDAIFGLHGMKYFTSLDLVRGYYQLPLEECSREYTAFSTPTNHWQFKRLSFGLKNAPSAFQREMQHVLAGFPRRRVLVYIDDVLIMSESFEEHLELVRKVLFTLEKHGVKIKPAKC